MGDQRVGVDLFDFSVDEEISTVIVLYVFRVSCDMLLNYFFIDVDIYIYIVSERFV
jgi:hypothetical protein